MIYLGSQLELAVYKHNLKKRIVKDVPNPGVDCSVLLPRDKEPELALTARAWGGGEQGLQVVSGARWCWHRKCVKVCNGSDVPGTGRK